MKSLICLLFIVPFAVGAMNCVRAPFMFMMIEALKIKSCQSRLFSNPTRLALSCRQLESRDLLDAIDINCYGNIKVCKNRQRLDDREFWFSQLASSRVVQFEQALDGAEIEELRGNIDRRDCVERVAHMTVAKTIDVLLVRASQLGAGIVDRGGKVPVGIITDCNEVINDIRKNTKNLLASKLKFCSVATKIKRSALKQDVCSLVPWSCSIKID